MPTRTVHCMDAGEYLKQRKGTIRALVTSLPDSNETGQSISQWEDSVQEWFRLCVESLAEDGVAVLFQTDRMYRGSYLSKAQYLYRAVDAVPESKILWHRIVLTAPPGSMTLLRPSYSHLIAVGGRRTKPGSRVPDVIPMSGKLYDNGMPINASRAAMEFVVNCGAWKVVDPFCGRGTVLAHAEMHGMDSEGVDIDPKQCALSEDLTFGDMVFAGASASVRPLPDHWMNRPFQSVSLSPDCPTPEWKESGIRNAIKKSLLALGGTACRYRLALHFASVLKTRPALTKEPPEYHIQCWTMRGIRDGWLVDNGDVVPDSISDEWFKEWQ